jgi:hypothetical protein
VAAGAVIPSGQSAEPAGERNELYAGFAEADITPKLGDKPVYLAGFGKNRKATAVHDSLKARAVVLKHGEQKLAIVSVDLVGYFHPNVVQVRERLPGFAYVLVSSTHNHDGPDTLGLWGPTAFVSGVDPDYMKLVEDRIVKVVQAADAAAQPVSARIGSVKAPELLHDGREPYVKHDDLVVLRFTGVKDERPVGLVVQWNCHPETMGGKNTAVSADYIATAVAELQRRHGCPVLYLTGTVGGLMTSLHVPIQDEAGKSLDDGTFEKTERYGRLLGQRADQALTAAKPLTLTPFTVRSRTVYLPMDNKGYLVMRQIGVLKRQAFVWQDDPYKAEPARDTDRDKRLCIRSEVAWLRLGELDLACIPGEIYPELVLDKVQDPPDPGADFPAAPVEPAIYKQLRGPHRMLVGLANDETGYIIPKRQWDEKPPFCYGRKTAQYGETNSLGPDTAPILCRAFQELVAGKP